MNIASMTSLFYSSRGTSKKTPAIEAICRLKNAGFGSIDLNLCGLSRNENEFCSVDWHNKTLELKDMAADLGVKFVQSHSPYWQEALAKTVPDYERLFKNALLRSCEIIHLMGIDKTVVHPCIDPMLPDAPLEHQIEYTERVHYEFLKKCSEYGICPAFENSPDYGRSGKYFSHAADLIALSNALSRYNAGVCWDFGHANITMDDQCSEIEQLKGRLICVHTHDNNGKYDAHVMPFIGTINWERVMPALKAADFTNDLVLEVAQNKNIPLDLQDASARLCAEAAQRLVEYYDGCD